MGLENTLSSSLTICVEPWADEFDLPSGSKFELTLEGGVEPALNVILADGRVTVWVNNGDVVGAEVDGVNVWD